MPGCKRDDPAQIRKGEPQMKTLKLVKMEAHSLYFRSPIVRRTTVNRIRYGIRFLSFCLCCLCGLPTTAWSQDSNVAAPTASISAAPISASQVPRLVRFSGTLLDDAAKPRTGVAGVTFLLYKDQAGGAPLWMETQNVNLDSEGHYSVLLGSSKPDGLPAELFAAGEARWLGVQAEREAEQPRVLLLSVPYALKAMDAETLGGRPVSDFVLSAPQNGGSPQAKKSAVSGDSGLAGVTGSGTKNFISIWTSTTALGNSTMFETGGKVGIGTVTPATALDTNGTGAFRDTLSLFPKGTDPTLSVQGTAFHVNNKGVVSFVAGQTFPGTGTITGVTAGTDLKGGGTSGNVTLNLDTSKVPQLNGGNIFNGNQTVNGFLFPSQIVSGPIQARNSSVNQFSTALFAEETSSAGETFGVQGFSLSSDALSAGVYGETDGIGSVTFGVEGLSNSTRGVGILGTAVFKSLTAGGIGCCPVGIWGDTGSNLFGAAGLVGTADDGRAIYLQNNSPSGVPTLFAFNSENTVNNLPVLVEQGAFGSCTFDTNGNEACTGLITGVVAVKQGTHKAALYAMESPENWFEDFGSGHLSGGAATITLDAGFAETVNTSVDYHVFLTPNGDCKGLYVSQKSASSFEVRELGGGASSIAFDFRIVAHRKGQESVRMQDMTNRLQSHNHLMAGATSVQKLP
jgi:hypothetical protein